MVEYILFPKWIVVNYIFLDFKKKSLESGLWWTIFSFLQKWMVVDYKLFKAGQPLSPGLLWVLEQVISPSGCTLCTLHNIVHCTNFVQHNQVIFPPAVIRQASSSHHQIVSDSESIKKKSESTETTMLSRF